MVTIQSRINQESGIPLGGIGTGTIEIRPDGYFHEWQIFNLGKGLGDWAPQQPEGCRIDGPSMGPGALAFFVRTRDGEGDVRMRRLGLRMDQHDLYSQAWLKSVEAITFDGRYPVARLAYRDASLPVEVSATFFSPFVPHDARTSGTPGFHCVFRLRNRSNEPIEAALLSTLQNPLAHSAEERRLVHSVAREEGGAACLTMRTAADAPCRATLGSLALATTGGEPSWVLGDFPQFFKGHVFWSDPFGIPYEGLLRDFRDAGRLPSLEAGRSPAGLLRLSEEEIEALALGEKEALVAQLRQYASFEAFWKRIASLAPEMLEGPNGLGDFLKVASKRLDYYEGNDRAKQAWGSAALASSVTLAPLEEKEIHFALGWHFPHHFSARGPELGHQYEHWFADAEAVARFLLRNRETHEQRAVGFSDTLYRTTLAPEMADAWSSQLATLSKCSWWTKAGDFAIWEGLGCCGFHTTDITYQGSFGILALFPELQKRQMEMGARHQREDGRVHHFFTPDLELVDEGFDRVDMNQQFVLLVCRDWLWTGDVGYIERLWPHVERAMDNIARLDADGDGLPDHDTRRNTYDGWNFAGTPAYIASLWLAALGAAVRLTEALGRGERAEAWRATLERGAASFEAKLWNGEYYSLWVDGPARDECCMSDQVSGEWFAHLVGIGSALPLERVRAALRAIFRYNYTEENGLANANYPPNRARRLATHGNCQQIAPWTGVEYAVASMLLDYGLVAEGERVVRNIHERYLGAGRFWNHVECGDHYYRAMSSWAVLLGATGFRLDAPRGRVRFAPVYRAPRFRGPWVAPTGWGTFEREATRFTLRCEAGALAFRELSLNLESDCACAELNGKAIEALSANSEGEALVLRFADTVSVREGDLFVVSRA